MRFELYRAMQAFWVARFRQQRMQSLGALHLLKVELDTSSKDPRRRAYPAKARV
jgi:hypothetical protein